MIITRVEIYITQTICTSLIRYDKISNSEIIIIGIIFHEHNYK